MHSYSIEDGFVLADGPVAAAVEVYTVAEGLAAEWPWLVLDN